MDENLVMEIWDTFKEYIPEKNREMAANQYVNFLLGEDFDAEDLEGYLGYDHHLDEAIKTIIDEHGDQDDYEEDYHEDDED